MSAYHSYRGRTIGRLLHFIHEYVPCQIADRVEFGGKRDEIFYCGKLWAKFSWEGETDYPIFTFIDDGTPYAIVQHHRRAQVILEDL